MTKSYVTDPHAFAYVGKYKPKPRKTVRLPACHFILPNGRRVNVSYACQEDDALYVSGPTGHLTTTRYRVTKGKP